MGGNGAGRTAHGEGGREGGINEGERRKEGLGTERRGRKGGSLEGGRKGGQSLWKPTYG